MAKRKVGVRFLNSKSTRIFLGDSIKNATSVLKKIAKDNGWEVESRPDNQEGKLVGWYYSIDDFCCIHIDNEDIVDEIKICNLGDHDIECDKELYSYDNMNEAGFEVIQAKNRSAIHSLNNLDDIIKESESSKGVEERPIIFGNDKVYRIGFIVNMVHSHLSSMVIKKYYMEYPFNSFERTNIEW